MAPAENFEADQPLIDALRGGDRYAFEELVRRHDRWVRGVIFGVLGDQDRVDDVAQQVWISLWDRISELRDTRAWRTWLYRLARNAAIDAGREATRRRRGMQELLSDPPRRAAPTSPYVETKSGEQHREVLSAIRALPALYREPFVLRHVSGWSYKEIAAMLGLAVDSVETRLVRARRFLRESLKDKVL